MGIAFEVRRVIGYRNSFLPRIRGNIIAVAEGSRIAVTMRLHPLVFVFMMIWMIGTASACVLFLIADIRRGGSFRTVFVPAIMLIFAWALVTGGFTYEARKAEPLLASVMPDGPKADAVAGSAPRR